MALFRKVLQPLSEEGVHPQPMADHFGRRLVANPFRRAPPPPVTTYTMPRRLRRPERSGFEPGNSTTGDDDMTRRRHGSIIQAAAAECGSAHSGGRAECESSAGSWR